MRNSDSIQLVRDITADTDLRLCRLFGLSDGWWLRQQVSHDTTIAKRKMAAKLNKIVPLGHAA